MIGAVYIPQELRQKYSAGDVTLKSLTLSQSRVEWMGDNTAYVKAPGSRIVISGGDYGISVQVDAIKNFPTTGNSISMGQTVVDIPLHSSKGFQATNVVPLSGMLYNFGSRIKLLSSGAPTPDTGNGGEGGGEGGAGDAGGGAGQVSPDVAALSDLVKQMIAAQQAQQAQQALQQGIQPAVTPTPTPFALDQQTLMILGVVGILAVTGTVAGVMLLKK